MIFKFDQCQLDTERVELRRDSIPVKIEPKVFHLLVYLIENRQRVISKDELIDAVWDGRIVSDATLNTSINGARRGVGDGGRSQSIIRTFPKRGFRFVADVESYGVADPGGTAKFNSFNERAGVPVTDRNEQSSVLVAPLRDLSIEAQQMYLADGLSEDLISALAKYGWFLVIGRGTSFSLKEGSEDARSLANRLGVNYLIDGSVRVSDDRLRVSINLVNVRDGTHLWSDRYDHEIKNIFKLQDDIVTNIARAIEPELTQAEGTRLQRTEPANLPAWGYALKAQFYLYKGSVEDVLRAIELAQKAVETDPLSAFGHRLLASSKHQVAMNTWSKQRGQTMSEAREAAIKALELNPRDAGAHQVRATIHMAYGRLEEALLEYDLALKLNPSLAHAYAGKAAALTYIGKPKQALPLFDEAVKVSPLDPNLSFWRCAQSLTYFMLGDIDQASSCAKYSIEHKKNWLNSRLFLIAILVSDLRLKEARREVQDLVDIQPNFDLKLAAKLNPFKRKKDLNILLDALREAGLPQ